MKHVEEYNGWTITAYHQSTVMNPPLSYVAFGRKGSTWFNEEGRTLKDAIVAAKRTIDGRM